MGRSYFVSRGMTMSIIEIMQVEHGFLCSQIEIIERMLPQTASQAEIRAQLLLFITALESHAMLEEKLLFRELETHLGADGTVISLRDNMGHHELLQALEYLYSQEDLEKSRQMLPSILFSIRKHFQAEEREMFRLAKSVIPDWQLQDLGKNWMAQRSVLA